MELSKGLAPTPPSKGETAVLTATSNHHHTRWTQSEDQILLESKDTAAHLAAVLGRTEHAVTNRRYLLVHELNGPVPTFKEDVTNRTHAASAAYRRMERMTAPADKMCASCHIELPVNSTDCDWC